MCATRTEGWTGARPPRRIVVALDGSSRAERVLPYVEELAARTRAKVILVRTWTPHPAADPSAAVGASPGATSATVPDAEGYGHRREAWRYLEGIADRLRERGVAADYEVVEGPAGEMIVDEAKGLGAEMLAITTHGRSGVGRLVLGSVADHVVRHTNCPVLLFRAA
jgi:nucleotide-binding universal stress UspA family protein